MLCLTCDKRSSCHTTCDEVEKALIPASSNDVPLVFFGEVREDNPKWNEDGWANIRFLNEKQALKQVLGPLMKMEQKARFLFIGRFYFGNSIDDLARIFKLRKRRIYGILKKAQSAMGRVSDSEDVQKPG